MSEDKEKIAHESTILFLLTLIAFIITIPSWGFVFYKFYSWFILPVFTQAPVITFSQAIGLSIFAMLLKRSKGKKVYRENDSFAGKTQKVIVLTLAPWVFLSFGWIAKVIFI
jgi:hypothetical protein